MLKTVLAAALMMTTLVGSAHPEDFVIDQKNKTFLYKGAKASLLKVKVGDVVQFRNLDPYFHNVFSLSDTKVFDLGSYAEGQSKSVTFDKPGKVDVECAIHPNMKMAVEVK